jgi:response regulator RpfG family c-di-GMP phosphodiesterase
VHFDPAVVDAYLACRDAFSAIAQRMPDAPEPAAEA